MRALAHCQSLLLGHRPPPDGAVRAAVTPAPATPITEVPYVVFDTELTGLHSRRDSIVSIGALKMAGSRILVGEQFNRIVQSRTTLTRESVVIHRITPSESRVGASFASLLPEFTAFCKGSVLVGHAVSIDLRFINVEMLRLAGGGLTNPVVDTMALHRYLKGRSSDHCAFRGDDPGRADLLSLAREKGIPMSRAHDALYDAFITAQLFQRYLAILPGFGIRTLGDLLKKGKP